MELMLVLGGGAVTTSPMPWIAWCTESLESDVRCDTRHQSGDTFYIYTAMGQIDFRGNGKREFGADRRQGGIIRNWV